jgi:hypothetical protein
MVLSIFVYNRREFYENMKGAVENGFFEKNRTSFAQ